MDKKEAIKIAELYANLVCRNFPVKKIILFGSTVSGKAKKHSDIDIAVVLNKNIGDILELETKLFKLRRDIDLRIEPILIDEKNDISGFYEQILKTGKIIYMSV